MPKVSYAKWLILAGVFAYPLIALASCSCSVGVSQKQGAYAGCTWKSDPPASALASINVNDALGTLNLTNMNVMNTSGTFTLTVANTASGQVLGQSNFGYYIANNAIYAQDPESIHNWLSQFAVYGSEEVTVTGSADDFHIKPTVQDGIARFGVSAKYQGIAYGSAVFQRQIRGGRICHPGRPCIITQPK